MLNWLEETWTGGFEYNRISINSKWFYNWAARPVADMLSPQPAVCLAFVHTRLGAMQIW